MHRSLTFIIYTIICLIFLGLREVAVCMADPFGNDDIDFDLEPMLAAAYKNAVACLRDDHPVNGSTLPLSLTNPITDMNARFTVDSRGDDNWIPVQIRGEGPRIPLASRDQVSSKI